MSNSEMIRNLIFCPSYQGNDEFLVEIQGRGLGYLNLTCFRKFIIIFSLVFASKAKVILEQHSLAPPNIWIQFIRVGDSRHVFTLECIDALKY